MLDQSRPATARPLDAFSFAALATLASLAVFFPGFMSDDSVVQLKQARAAIYTNVQPPLMSIIWRAVDSVIKGQTGMLILQNYLYWAGLALILLPCRRSWLYFPAVIAIGLFPPTFLLQGTIWKDNLMGGFMLTALGFYVLAFLYRIEAADPRGIKRVACLAASVACVFLALMMRHNAVFAIFPLLYLVASEALATWHPPKRVLELKPLAASAAATVALFFLASASTEALANRHFRLSQLVAVYDIVAVAAMSGEPVFNGEKHPALKDGFTGPYQDHAAVAKAYNPCDVFPVFMTFTWGEALWTLTDNSAVVDDAWSAWRDAAAEHPGLLIAHKFRVFACSLGFGEMGPWYAPIFFDVPPKAEALGIHSSGLSVFQKYIADQAWYLSKSAIYKVYIYFIMAVAIALLALFGRNRLDQLPFCVAVSGLMYQGGFLCIGIGTEFRYYIWLILCAILSATLYAIPRLRWQASAA